jgi:hypothetical protein
MRARIHGAMIGIGGLTVLALAATAANGPDGAVALPPPAAGVTPTARVMPTAAAALRVVLASHPRVLAVGELHETKQSARGSSALKRFTREFLPVLKDAGATDLVVETWITTGSCGEAERKAVAQVEKTTERPAHTENEVVALLEQAKAAGMVPRILEIGCKDYQAVMGGAEVDFDRLLRLTRDQLVVQIRAALARTGSRLVVSYGGALHNDLHPTAELAPYAFGPTIAAAVAGRYVELDLYVPELIAKDAPLRAEPWFAVYRRAARPGQVTLVRRGQSSYALVFP